MKIVALVPIKLGSERVKGKNVRPFCDGTTLVQFILKTLSDCRGIDEIYVYCSDETIRDHLTGRAKFLKRSTELDLDTVNANDIIREFMKTVDADVYVLSHATAPFTKTESIEKCIDAVVDDNGHDSAFTVERLQTFLWSEGKPVNFDPNHFPRTQDLEPLYLETSGAFVFTREVFEKYGRRIGVNPCLVEVSPEEGCDIDTEFDMMTAQAIYKYIKEGETYEGSN